MAALTYVDAVRELESRGIMPKTAPSLEPMRQALPKIGFKPDPAKVIVVAGTNGKGSICATLEALLIAAGERVGLYTSPHLIESTERFRVDGRDITPELFLRAYRRVHEATRDAPPSHFEMLTLMAADLFSSGALMAPVDRMIFEVGLGGTWDATNAIPHATCVIASLGRDHENLLGDTLPEIAANKFGIVTPGALVVHSPLPEEVRALARRVASETDSRWVEAKACALQVKRQAAGPVFRLATPWGDAPLKLPGARGAQNTATALTLFRELGFDVGRHLGALNNVYWPGRMERFEWASSKAPIYLSGDHNPQGVASLLEILPHYPRRHLHILVGVGVDKDLDGILGPLFAIPDASVYLTETPFKGRALGDYGKWVSQARGAEAEPGKIFAEITRRAEPDDLILVTGSLYLVGSIKALHQPS